jgi:hypothetical protein
MRKQTRGRTDDTYSSGVDFDGIHLVRQVDRLRFAALLVIFLPLSHRLVHWLRERQLTAHPHTSLPPNHTRNMCPYEAAALRQNTMTNKRFNLRIGAAVAAADNREHTPGLHSVQSPHTNEYDSG